MKKRNYIFTILILMIALSASSIQAQKLAFPTAEGFGKFSTGGRGGKVIEVTNLGDYTGTDSIRGTLRWALNQYPGQPLTVVFKTSGIIVLNSAIRCGRNGLTIAGQTAPGDGICVRGGQFNLGSAQNLIIRHIRFRIGLSNGNTGGFLVGGSVDFENGSQAIFDHCDFGWAGEENITMYDDHYVTVQWSVLHEGLYASGHEKGARSYGAQWGGSPATMHHNIFAHNVTRSGRFNGSSNALGDLHVLIDFANNVDYNWGKTNSCYGGEREAGRLSTHQVNFVGNYYKPGPTTPTSGSSFIAQSAARSGYVSTGPSYWYLSGNIMEGDDVGTADNWHAFQNGSIYPTDSLKRLSPITIPDQYKITYTSAQDAYQAVLAHAGAFPRDTVDRRIMHEVATKTAIGTSTVQFYHDGTDTTVLYTNPYYGKTVGIIDQPAGAGGYPTYNTYNTITDADHDGMDDVWELANGLDPTNPNDRNLLTADGYTALEVYLNSLVGENIVHNFAPSAVQLVPAHNISVYPSITTDKLTLTSDVSLKWASIYSIEGTKVLNVTLGSSKTIDVISLARGCYILEVSTLDGAVERLKFIKK